VHFLFLLSLTLMLPAISQANMTCAQILEKAKPIGKGKKAGKAACVMVEHTIGMGRGTAETVYDCKGAKYKLLTDEDYSCTVTVLHK